MAGYLIPPPTTSPDASHIKTPSASQAVMAPFMFLSLPRELRDEIYRHILCFPASRSVWDARGRDTFMRSGMHDALEYDGDLPERTIFRTSCQVYSEAYLVYLKENKIVRIVQTYDVAKPLDRAQRILNPVPGPFVPLSEYALEHFPGFCMTHAFETVQTTPSRQPRSTHWKFTITCAILARDLPAWCEALLCERVAYIGAQDKLYDAELGHYYLFIHQLCIHDPFWGTQDSLLKSVARQAPLLQPYRENVHGLAGFMITGHVDPALAAAVTASVTAPGDMYSLSSPRALCAEIIRRLGEGDALFARREPEKASKVYCRVMMQIAELFSVDRLDKYSRMARVSALMQNMSDLWYYLQQRRAACVLQAMERKAKEADADGALLQSMQDNVQEAFEGATGQALLAPVLVVLGYGRTKAQMEELHDQSLVAALLADPDHAEHGMWRLEERVAHAVPSHDPLDDRLDRNLASAWLRPVGLTIQRIAE